MIQPGTSRIARRGLLAAGRGIRGEEKLIRGFLTSLHQKWRDLTRRHEDPERLSREVVRLHSQGLYANAVIVARRLADLQRERLGPRHPEYAAAISNLGLLFQQEGNLDEAQTLLTEALDLRRESFGESHPQFAIGLLQLADIVQARGDLDAAERLIRQALDVQGNRLGANHPDLAGSLTSHALLLVRRGDVAAAEPLLRKALAIRKDHHGERHSLYASALSNLALLLWRRGDSAAEPLLRQSLAIRNEALGPNHPDSVESREYLAAISEEGQPDMVPGFGVIPTDEASASALLKLSAEYAEISQALADASRPGRALEAAALADLSERAERGQQTLKAILDASRYDFPNQCTTIKHDHPPINSPLEGEGGQRPEEGLHTETPRMTARSKRIDPVNPAPISAKRERDPVRVQALSLLDRILEVKPLKPGSVDLLASYLKTVKSLRQCLDTSEEQFTDNDLAIVQLSHPVTAMLRLANGESLSTQDWLDVYTLAAESFGRPLATAASKGQIVFPPDATVSS